MINKKNNKRTVRRISIILAFILLPIGAFGFGYFLDKDNQNKAVGQTLTVEGSIGGTIANTNVKIENIVPGDTINQSIKINSTSTASSLMRVKIDPIWEGKLANSNIKLIYEDGVKVDDQIRSEGSKYWYKCSDGYLYYMSTVENDGEMNLVKGIKFLGGTDDTDANKYQDKELSIEVTMDIIQSKYAPFKTKWNITDTNLITALEKLCAESNKLVEE